MQYRQIKIFILGYKINKFVSVKLDFVNDSIDNAQTFYPCSSFPRRPSTHDKNNTDRLAINYFEFCSFITFHSYLLSEDIIQIIANNINNIISLSAAKPINMTTQIRREYLTIVKYQTQYLLWSAVHNCQKKYMDNIICLCVSTSIKP